MFLRACLSVFTFIDRYHSGTLQAGQKAEQVRWSIFPLPSICSLFPRIWAETILPEDNVSAASSSSSSLADSTGRRMSRHHINKHKGKMMAKLKHIRNSFHAHKANHSHSHKSKNNYSHNNNSQVNGVEGLPDEVRLNSLSTTSNTT